MRQAFQVSRLRTGRQPATMEGGVAMDLCSKIADQAKEAFNIEGPFLVNLAKEFKNGVAEIAIVSNKAVDFKFLSDLIEEMGFQLLEVVGQE